MCDFAPLNPSPDYVTRFLAAMSGLVAPGPVSGVVASTSEPASAIPLTEADRAPGAVSAVSAPGVARQGEGR